jgi:hypothetical protein
MSTRPVMVAIMLAFLPATGVAQTAGSPVPAVWFGTWTVNVGKSTYTGAPGYRRATYVIEPADDGLKVVYEMVLPRGGVTHLEWIGRLDGEDYPVQGIDEFLTYAYTPRADGSYAIVAKVDSRVAAFSEVRFSADDRTMITTTIATGPQGQRITTSTVYEKQ